MFQIRRLNHAVLYVRDAERAARFYQDVLGFVVSEHMGDRAYFLRTNATTGNNHDLGLFSIGPDAPPPTRGERVGLYHLAWQIDTLPELAQARDALVEANALVGVNDHGASLSLYAHDPDGNEFEVFWAVPREEWATREGGRLDIEGELAKRGLATASAWRTAPAARAAGAQRLRRERLDHFIVLDEQHLATALGEYAASTSDPALLR